MTTKQASHELRQLSDRRFDCSANKSIFTWRPWRKVLLIGSAAFVFLVLTAMVLGPSLVDSAAILEDGKVSIPAIELDLT